MRIFAFVLLALFLLPTTQNTAFAQTVGTETRLIGLSGSVTVRRDARSIPYIEASNDADLFFMQGYVTASDRLWQMDLLRRVARGATAEIFGRSTLEEDKRWRRFGFAGIAEESLKYLEPELKAALENYARGVNAYANSLDAKQLPVEFQILQYKPGDWTPADTIVIGKILADALSSTYSGDLMRDSLKNFDPAKLADLNNKVTPYDVILFGKDAATEPAKKLTTERTESTENSITSSEDRRAASSNDPSGEANSNNSVASVISVVENDLSIRERSLSRVGLYAEELAASNNWVVSGKRTADGKPILANDPHLWPTAPGIWYLSHLSTPTMRVSGVTFPGVPGIVLGHNEHIAWGATNVGPDVQDVYFEKVNDRSQYETPGGWKPLKFRSEDINVRTNPLNPATTVEDFTVSETANGPLIIETKARAVSLKWTAFDPKNLDFSAFYSLNRARNWDEFKKALSGYGGAMQNFVYADTNGNIGWYAAGKVPVRRKGDGSLPYDGSSKDGDWIGFVPFNELPNLYNPPEGFIMTANQRIAGTDYKHQQVIRDIAPPWRARRLYEILSKDTKVTMDSTTAAMMDAQNIPLSMLAKEIVLMKAAPDEQLKLISAWDGKMTPDSKAALLVNEIRSCAATKIADANKPAPVNAIRDRILYWAITERSARWLPAGFKDYGELLRGCHDSSVATFTTRYGADQEKWTWGRMSVASFPHSLAAAPLIGGQFATPKIPIAGSGQTPNVASFVSMKHIASPGDWDATRHVIPLGQSGDPKSPHFKDQFESWSTGKPAVFPFSKEAVARSTVSSVTYGKP